VFAHQVFSRSDFHRRSLTRCWSIVFIFFVCRAAGSVRSVATRVEQHTCAGERDAGQYLSSFIVQLTSPVEINLPNTFDITLPATLD
jgi:hypothetical protein